MKKFKTPLLLIMAACLGYATSHYQLFSKIGDLFHTPKISVVMSTYNRANIVGEAIESVLNQTEPDFEFIIIDDGSKDNTFETLKEYAQKDKRIKVLRNETNKGLIYSLNRGLDEAKGELIARMDDDDAMIPWRLERQALAMKLYPTITLMGARILGAEGQTTQKTTLPLIEDPNITQINTYTSSGLAHPTVMFRKDFVNKHNIRYRADNLYAEDCGLYADILNAGGKISTLQEHLLKYSVKKNLNKPENYGYIQYDTFKKIQKEKLSRLMEYVDDSLLGHSRETPTKCKIWVQMIEANKTKNIVDQKTLEDIHTKHCPTDVDNAIWVKHKFWDDFFIFDGKNRVYRHSNKDAATIVKNTSDTLIIDWDKYGTEEFKKDNPTKYSFVKEVK
ncbi:MAG: glycosyltransferase family 2 protein [Alphaproteobacteria bacterium]|nr:glycosyltransferase family 2 protein [Alphaproteobacteria bacterium]